MTPRWHSERGSEIVEFALASTLFFCMMFAGLRAGVGMWQYNQLSVLAQEGARYVSVRGTASKGSYFSTGTKTDLIAYVRARGGNAITVSINPDVEPKTIAPGTTVTVTLSRPMVGWAGFANWTGNIQASARMQVSR